MQSPAAEVEGGPIKATAARQLSQESKQQQQVRRHSRDSHFVDSETLRYKTLETLPDSLEVNCDSIDQNQQQQQPENQAVTTVLESPASPERDSDASDNRIINQKLVERAPNEII